MRIEDWEYPIHPGEALAAMDLFSLGSLVAMKVPAHLTAQAKDCFHLTAGEAWDTQSLHQVILRPGAYRFTVHEAKSS